MRPRPLSPHFPHSLHRRTHLQGFERRSMYPEFVLVSLLAVFDFVARVASLPPRISGTKIHL